MQFFDIIVVGGGVIGASIFHRLAKDGLKIALVERDRICQGATAYSGGVVRCYHSNSVLSDKAVRGYKYYRNFEDQTKTQVKFNECGFLYFGERSRIESIQGEINRLSTEIEIEWLSALEAKRKFPYLKLNDSMGVVYEPKAGYMDTYMTTKAWVNAGEKIGGVVMEGVKVERLIIKGGRFVGVQSSMGPIYSNRVVICAGALVPELLSNAGIESKIYAQAIQVNRFHSKSLSCPHPAYIDDVFDLNGRPDGSGLMLAGHPTNDRVFVDKKNSIDLMHTNLTIDFSKKRFEWAESLELRGGFKCFDAYTQDGMGEIRYADENASILIAGGFSGGGFKLAPAIAEDISYMLRQ